MKLADLLIKLNELSKDPAKLEFDIMYNDDESFDPREIHEIVVKYYDDRSPYILFR